MRTLILLALVFVLVESAICQPPDSLWCRHYGSGGLDYCSTVRQTSDGGFVVIGYATLLPYYIYYCWLVKTDANGDTLWSRFLQPTR